MPVGRGLGVRPVPAEHIERLATEPVNITITIDNEALRRLRAYAEALPKQADAIVEIAGGWLRLLGQKLAGVMSDTMEEMELPFTGQMQDTLAAKAEPMTETGARVTVGSFPEIVGAFETNLIRHPISYGIPLIRGSSYGSNKPHAGRVYYWIANKLGLDPRSKEAQKVYTAIWKRGTEEHDFITAAQNSPRWSETIAAAERDLQEAVDKLLAPPKSPDLKELKQGPDVYVVDQMSQAQALLEARRVQAEARAVPRGDPQQVYDRAWSGFLKSRPSRRRR